MQFRAKDNNGIEYKKSDIFDKFQG